MKSAWLLSAGLALALFSTGAFAQTMDFSKVQILTQQIGPNVYMLTGSSGLDPSHEDAAGGRVGVLAGPDGVLMVDAQYAQLTDKVLAAVRKISTGPIRLSGQYPHPSRPYRGQRILCQAGRRDLCPR